MQDHTDAGPASVFNAQAELRSRLLSVGKRTGGHDEWPATGQIRVSHQRRAIEVNIGTMLSYITRMRPETIRGRTARMNRLALLILLVRVPPLCVGWKPTAPLPAGATQVGDMHRVMHRLRALSSPSAWDVPWRAR